MEGFVFALSPSTRASILKDIPGAFPANRIFVAYEINQGFDEALSRIEPFVVQALLGLPLQDAQRVRLSIEFVESSTGKVIHRLAA